MKSITKMKNTNIGIITKEGHLKFVDHKKVNTLEGRFRFDRLRYIGPSRLHLLSVTVNSYIVLYQ